MKRMSFLIICVLLVALLSGCIQINVGEPKATAEETPTEAATKAPVAEATEATEAPEMSAIATLASWPTSHEVEYYLFLTPTICESFSPSDWVFGDLQYQSSASEAIAAFGTPNSTETEEWGADGSIHEYLYYDFGHLSFEEDMLNDVYVEESGYPGPRGIEVGDMLESVVLKFCTTYEKYDSNTLIFYRENEGRDNEICLPPSAMLCVDDTKTLCYDYCEADDYFGEGIEEMESYVMYMPTYSFFLRFDENDLLVSYGLHYGASAE